MSARPVQAVLHDDDQARTQAVAALLDGTEARVVRVGNPLRAPLTLDRILMQVAGPDGDATASDPASATAAIAQRQGTEASVLLLVEQAETLHPSALRSLQAMLPYFERDGQPSLALAFAGRTAFRDLLAAPELDALRAVLGEQPEARPAPVAVLRTKPPPAAPPLALPAAPPPPAPMRPTMPVITAPPRAPAPRQPRRIMLKLAAVLLLLGGAGAAAYQGVRSMFYRDAPQRPALLALAPAPALVPQPGPSPAPAPLAPLPPAPPEPRQEPGPPAPVAVLPAEPEPPLPAVITPPLIPSPSAPTVAQAARLRRDFEAFLARSGRGTAGLSDEERRELFDEYVEWRAQNAGNAAAPRPRAPGPRIVINVPAGSIEAGVTSGRLQVLLDSRPGTVEARTVADGPARPTVVFYHPEDEAAARQTAGWMAEAGLAWSVRDLTSFQPRPERGLVEVWLPGR